MMDVGRIDAFRKFLEFGFQPPAADTLKLLDEVDGKFAAVASAFVTETRRADGDYVPERRFRALLPGGTLAYGASREEAEAAFWDAVEKEGGGA